MLFIFLSSRFVWFWAFSHQPLVVYWYVRLYAEPSSAFSLIQNDMKLDNVREKIVRCDILYT